MHSVQSTVRCKAVCCIALWQPSCSHTCSHTPSAALCGTDQQTEVACYESCQPRPAVHTCPCTFWQTHAAAALTVTTLQATRVYTSTWRQQLCCCVLGHLCGSTHWVSVCTASCTCSARAGSAIEHLCQRCCRSTHCST
jgi:hypothetical protein